MVQGFYMQVYMCFSFTNLVSVNFKMKQKKLIFKFCVKGNKLELPHPSLQSLSSGHLRLWPAPQCGGCGPPPPAWWIYWRNCLATPSETKKFE